MLTLRKVAGFLSALIQISDSHDSDLTEMFNDSCLTQPDRANAWQDAVLMLYTHAAIHTDARETLPTSVCTHVVTASTDAHTIDVACRLVTLYIKCNDRVRFSGVLFSDSDSDKLARRIVSPCTMQSVLASLVSVHV